MMTSYIENGGKMRTNLYVILCWLNDIPYWVRGKPIRTDGKRLSSYNIEIGYTRQNGDKTVKMYTALVNPNYFISITTSCHINYAAALCDKRERPC